MGSEPEGAFKGRASNGRCARRRQVYQPVDGWLLGGLLITRWSSTLEGECLGAAFAFGRWGSEMDDSMPASARGWLGAKKAVKHFAHSRRTTPCTAPGDIILSTALCRRHCSIDRGNPVRHRNAREHMANEVALFPGDSRRAGS